MGCIYIYYIYPISPPIYIHIHIYIYINIFYRKIFDNIFVFEAAMPEKGLKIWPISKNLKLKSLFLNIFQKKILQKWTPRTLFTLFWYPSPHMWNFHFFCRGVPGVPKNIFLKIFKISQGVPKLKNKIIKWYLEIISTRVCKKNFWLKQKKIYCPGCSKSVVKEGKTFNHRRIRKKCWVMSQIFSYG